MIAPRQGEPCARPGCSATSLPYGPYCPADTAGHVEAVEVPCQAPLRCYCPREGCLGHESVTHRPVAVPMPAELRAQVRELAARYQTSKANHNQGETR